jgi:predicted RNase H-like HicB family nuclease
VSSDNYTYRAEWSPEDGEYVGLVGAFPSLSWLAPTEAEALAGIERLVDDVVADLIANDESVPTPAN